jgi:hypothetical protein
MPLLLGAGIFLGIGFGKGCRTDAGGYGVKSEAISTPFLTRYWMESSMRLFTCFRDSHFRLVGGKGLRLGRDLIRLTEESVCRLNCERSIVDVA